MTALWRALTDDYQDFTVFVSLCNAVHPQIEICRRYMSKSEMRMPLWADDPTQTFERKYCPVSLLCPGSEGESAVDLWTEIAGAGKAT